MKDKLLLVLAILITSTVTAQQLILPPGVDNMDSVLRSRPIITDRPAMSSASSTVPRRTLQIETGFIYENTQTTESETNDWLLGTTLLRYGVWERLELRAASFYQVRTEEMKESGSDTIKNGLGPLMLGFKVFVVREKGLRPEISILAEMTLRHLGHDEYKPTYSYPIAKVAASHTLTQDLSLGYNAGFGYNGENPDGFFIYSVVLSYKITSRLSFFGEAYGSFDNGNLPNHRIDGGFVYLARHNLQFDITGGTGFDSNVDKSFLNAGLAWRIPH